MTTVVMPQRPIPHTEMRCELALLLACSHLVYSAEQCQHIQSLVESGPDWSYVLKAAVQHKVVPLLYQGLRQACPNNIPKGVDAYLSRYCQVNTLKNLFLDQKLQEILANFKAAHIPAIAYKGPTLAKVAYGSLSLRQFTDLDLLVRPKDFRAAQDLLIQQGLTSCLQLGWEVHCTSTDQQVSVDLHRSLVPKFFGLPDNFIDPQEPDLSPETQLLLLTIQLGKDCCHWKLCLGQICDIAALLHRYPQLDFAAVRLHATQLGCLRFLGIAMILVQDLLHVDLPADIVAELATQKVSHQLAQWIRHRIITETDHPTVVPDDAGFWYFLRVYNHQFYLRARERWQDKLLYCAHWSWKIIRMSLKPNQADRDLIKLPSFLGGLYVPIHVVRLFYKYLTKGLTWRPR